MKKLFIIGFVAVLASVVVSCEKEAFYGPSLRGRSSERVSVADNYILNVFGAVDEESTKSDLVSPNYPDAIYDLNVWQYTQNGNLLSSFYVDELSFTSGSASVNIRTDIAQYDRLVVIANAGRALSAPSTMSTTATFDYVISQATMSGYMGILAVGICNSMSYNSEADRWNGHVYLSRAMARLDFQIKIGDTWKNKGVRLQTAANLFSHNWDGVTISDVRIKNMAKKFSFVPNDPTTVQNYYVTSASDCFDGDKLVSISVADNSLVSNINSVYALPNLQYVHGMYTHTFAEDHRDLSTYMVFKASVVAADGGTLDEMPGEIGYRCYPAGNNKYTDIVGGKNYRNVITIDNHDYSTETALIGDDYFGVRTDTRFKPLADNTCESGELITVYLNQPMEMEDTASGLGDSWTEADDEFHFYDSASPFSLSSTGSLLNDGHFRIHSYVRKTSTVTDEVTGTTYTICRLCAVRLLADTPGTSTLYYRRNFEGLSLAGSIELKAIRKTIIDIGGGDEGGGEINY